MGESPGHCPSCRAPTKGGLYRNEALLHREAEVQRLRRREAKLVETLKFYANMQNYTTRDLPKQQDVSDISKQPEVVYRPPIRCDFGQRARTALEQLKG